MRALVLAAGASGALAGLVSGGLFLTWFLAGSDALDAPFGGWQVELAEWGQLGVLLVLTAAVVLLTVRGWRRWRGRIRVRIDVALVALLLGLGIAALVDAGMHKVVNFASDHTAEAARLARLTEVELGDSEHPPLVPEPYPLAPADISRALLRPQDLGSGWYFGTTPDPVLLSVSTVLDPGARSRARTVLTQEHWQGGAWAVDHTLFETCIQFGLPGQAMAAASAFASRGSVADLTLVTAQVQGLTVFERTYRLGVSTNQQTAFATGTRFCTLSTGISDSHLIHVATRAAVDRARTIT